MHNIAVYTVTQDAECMHMLQCVHCSTSLCWDGNVTACPTGVAPLRAAGTVVRCKLKAGQTDRHTDGQWTRIKHNSGHCQFVGASSN